MPFELPKIARNKRARKDIAQACNGFIRCTGGSQFHRGGGIKSGARYEKIYIKEMIMKTFLLYPDYNKNIFLLFLMVSYNYMSGLRTFFFSPRKLGFHVLLAMVLLVVIFVVALAVLKSYTRHGTEVVMPDFIGMNAQELLMKEDISKDYIIVVSDYIYDRKTLPGTVLKQDPHVGEMVKKGRKVYVTVASSDPPKVTMPQLQDVSLRQAEIMLRAIGLERGTVIFKPSPFENAVLEQLYNGRAIAPGTEISAGETITLVVGKNPGDLPLRNRNETTE
ncbi:MAG: PASTA domain-containing protein [Bacteroidetes bacterium]|nr:PASTA domain-containing protein [Bacteroidota bacterium]